MTQSDPAFDVDGKVVFVTGGSRGIGLGMVEYLAEAGCRIVTSGRDEERLEPAIEACEKAGVESLALVFDVREYDDAVKAMEKVGERFGRLDALINNAGGSFAVPTVTMSPRAWASIININLSGVLHCSKAAFPMLSQSQGSIVNIASRAGVQPTPTMAAYGAAKAGVIHLTATLAMEWASSRIRVNCVAPGLIETELAREYLFGGDQEAMDRAAQGIGVGRVGQPVDIARACRYLISDAGNFVNGATLLVDGGQVSPNPRDRSAEAG